MLNEFRSRKIGLNGYQTPVLRRHLDGYLNWMVERGYSRTTIHGYLGHLRSFAEFQRVRKIKLHEISNAHVDTFRRWYASSYQGPFPRRKSYSPQMGEQQSAAVNSFLTYLRSVGVVKACDIPGENQPIIVRYLNYLKHHRGLADSTIKYHRRRSLKFYHWLDSRSLDFHSMTAKDIEDYILASRNSNAPTERSAKVSFMKVFLQFLRANKIISKTCQPFLPNRRHYRHATLPETLSPPQAQAVLKSVDRSTPTGKRDYAILKILKTYGIRGGELARLTLDDIDWRSRVIHVWQSKSRRKLDLPLLPPVGRAVISYLRHRPKYAKERNLFLCWKAPYKGMTTAGIWQIVAKALNRSGIYTSKRGSHLFRYSRATDLLREGNSLKTIGDLLGHKQPKSTYWYCKLAVSDLRQVALELPGGVQ